MRLSNDHFIFRSAKILRFLVAPLVLFALAALILTHNSRADERTVDMHLGSTDEEFLTDEEIIQHEPEASSWFTFLPHSNSWDSLLDQQGGQKIHFGAKLGGPLPLDRNAQESFVPASITKLFTAGAALEKLGPDYQFKTILSWKPLPGTAGQVTDLTVSGAGDPSWGVATFDQLATLLVQSGVRGVHGVVRFASPDSRWNSEAFPIGWSEQDRVTCDGALPQAFNIALNCATLVIRNPARAEWLQAGVPTPVRLKLAAGAHTALSVERESRGILISGTWAAGAETRSIALPVYDSAEWGRRLLIAALQRKNIPITPAPPRRLASTAEKTETFLSPPLREILKPLLKRSRNLIGQDLMIAMGGLEVLREYVVAHLPIQDAVSVTLHDGSGMSRSNRVSPSAVYEFLTQLPQAPHFDVIWGALAIAGVDGTLKSRMRGSEAEGVLRAKTGTLRGTYNLAGYIPRFNAIGEPESYVPFVILTRTTADLRYAALAAHNRVGIRLSSLVGH